MRTIIASIAFLCACSAANAQAADELNKVTFALGAGYSYIFSDIYQSSLTTDSVHSLQLQKLSRSNFVISSVIVFKLGRLQMDHQTGKLYGRTAGSAPRFWERLSIDLAVNLVELNAENISFNKAIDGGLGVGCFLTPNIQLAVFFDITRYRQLQDWVTARYNNQPIPNDDEYLNALDENDNDLFYTKAIPGLSFKAVFSIGNKK